MQPRLQDDDLRNDDADECAVSLDESFAWCRRIARRKAGNFYFSFLTLPRPLFRDMCALYAFMRVSDDLGDDERVPLARRRGQLAAWRSGLQQALRGESCSHSALPALVDVVNRHAIPHEYLYAVLEGVAGDLDPAGFETFDELAQYCYRVAGVVGLCCIHVWGFHDERAIPAAIDCGIAFQMTNILRDLKEDARAGRIYLPREDLRRFDYSPDDLSRQVRSPQFDRLMQFEVERARAHYQRARTLFDYLDPPGRPIYAAMLGIYGGLLDKIERRRYDVFTRRVALSRPAKVAIALGAMLRYRRS